MRMNMPAAAAGIRRILTVCAIAEDTPIFSSTAVRTIAATNPATSKRNGFVLFFVFSFFSEYIIFFRFPL